MEILWDAHEFIFSPPEGYLDCFQVLAIINKAAINIHVQVFFFSCRYKFSTPLGKYRRVQLLDLMGRVCLVL